MDKLKDMQKELVELSEIIVRELDKKKNTQNAFEAFDIATMTYYHTFCLVNMAKKLGDKAREIVDVIEKPFKDSCSMWCEE